MFSAGAKGQFAVEVPVNNDSGSRNYKNSSKQINELSKFINFTRVAIDDYTNDESKLMDDDSSDDEKFYDALDDYDKDVITYIKSEWCFYLILYR